MTASCLLVKAMLSVPATFSFNVFIFYRHKVVIVEGNYLLLDEDVWRDISSVFDEKW